MSSTTKTYTADVDLKNNQKIRDLLKNYPPFCKTFFIGIEPKTSTRTRLAYAYDLGLFFDYLTQNISSLEHDPSNISLELLGKQTSQDIEEYLFYLKCYEKDGATHTNDERGLKRKLASLKTFYHFLYKHDMIDSDVSTKVEMPKIHDKNIIRLDMDEVRELLDQVESGENLIGRQKSFHDHTKIRDTAMLTLMLGTGIRVSECVGIDLADVDFKNDGVKVHRKGGSDVMVYFGSEVRGALLSYYDFREDMQPAPGHENALFLSLQNRRITVRSVQNLVKKYSMLVTTVKHITPHKLRSTYGTNLYKESGDIYLVADVLGHKDVNTTRKHYAAIEEDRRKLAADQVHLRERRTDKDDL